MPRNATARSRTVLIEHAHHMPHYCAFPIPFPLIYLWPSLSEGGSQSTDSWWRHLGWSWSSVNRPLPGIGQWVNMTSLTAMQLTLPKVLPPAVRRLTPTLRQRMLLVLTMPLEVFDTPKLNQ